MLAGDVGGFGGEEVFEAVGAAAVLALGHHAGLAEVGEGAFAETAGRFLI